MCCRERREAGSHRGGVRGLSGSLTSGCSVAGESPRCWREIPSFTGGGLNRRREDDSSRSPQWPLLREQKGKVQMALDNPNRPGGGGPAFGTDCRFRAASSKMVCGTSYAEWQAACSLPRAARPALRAASFPTHGGNMGPEDHKRRERIATALWELGFFGFTRVVRGQLNNPLVGDIGRCPRVCPKQGRPSWTTDFDATRRGLRITLRAEWTCEKGNAGQLAPFKLGRAPGPAGDVEGLEVSFEERLPRCPGRGKLTVKASVGQAVPNENAAIGGGWEVARESLQTILNLGHRLCRVPCRTVWEGGLVVYPTPWDGDGAVMPRTPGPQRRGDFNNLDPNPATVKSSVVNGQTQWEIKWIIYYWCIFDEPVLRQPGQVLLPNGPPGSPGGAASPAGGASGGTGAGARIGRQLGIPVRDDAPNRSFPLGTNQIQWADELNAVDRVRMQFPLTWPLAAGRV